jgi:hypothetical protein
MSRLQHVKGGCSAETQEAGSLERIISKGRLRLLDGPKEIEELVLWAARPSRWRLAGNPVDAGSLSNSPCRRWLFLRVHKRSGVNPPSRSRRESSQ